MMLGYYNSSIAIATYIDSWAHVEVGAVKEFGPDLEIHAAIGDYFLNTEKAGTQFGTGARADVPISCPTSNCTWESYETLAVCSECVDVADLLEFDCRHAKLDWVKNGTSDIPYEMGMMCGWFLNSNESTLGANSTLMLGYEVDPKTNRTGEILTTRTLPLVTNITRRSIFNGSINFKHIRNPITDFIAVTTAGKPDLESALRSVFQHERPRALECVLAFCVKKFESTYNDATYTEVVKEHFINTTAGPRPWTTVPAKNLSDPTEKSYVYYLQNITIDPHASDGHANSSSFFGVGNDTAADIITDFDDYLPSFYTRPKNSSSLWMKYATNQETPRLREDPPNPWAAPTNVSQRLEDLAMTMTNRLRNWGNDTTWGKTYSEETFIEVRWEWLTLPITVLVLTLVFLLSTMWRSSVESDRVGVWKNSSIATLLYGLPELQWKVAVSQRAQKSHSRKHTFRGWLFPGKDGPKE